jgi:hypothetical protein
MKKKAFRFIVRFQQNMALLGIANTESSDQTDNGKTQLPAWK